VLGGTPVDKIRYDNLKSAVSRVLFGRGRAESARWVAFRSHYPPSTPSTACPPLGHRRHRHRWPGRPGNSRRRGPGRRFGPGPGGAGVAGSAPAVVAGDSEEGASAFGVILGAESPRLSRLRPATSEPEPVEPAGDSAADGLFAYDAAGDLLDLCLGQPTELLLVYGPSEQAAHQR